MPRVSPPLLAGQMVCALRSLCHSCPPPTDTPPACAPLPRSLDCDAFRCRSLLCATPPIAGSTAAPTWPLRSTPFADAHCVVWISAHVSACPPIPPTPTSIRNNSPHPLSTKSDADRRSPAPTSAPSYLAYAADTLQPLQPFHQYRMLLQLHQQLLLRRLKALQPAPAQLEQILYRFRYFCCQILHQFVEILLPVQPLLVVLHAAFHQQPADLVLHPHRLLQHQVAIAQYPSQLAPLARRYPARRQQVGANQVADRSRVQLVVLLLRRANGFHPPRVPHFQLGRKRLQRIVDPSAQQGCFHGPVPRLRAFAGPLAQRHPPGRQLAFFHNHAIGQLHAVADAFLVDVESDIVVYVYVHWVLLSEVSEPAVESRSRYCTQQENPSPSQSLYIRTDAISS